MMNGAFSATNLYFVGEAGNRIILSKSRIAKCFYCVGITCNSLGSACSLYNSVMMVRCPSYISVALGCFGKGLSLAGDKLNSAANILENRAAKKGWFRSPSKIITGHKGLSFVPGSNSYCPVTFKDLFVNLPVDKIILIGGSILTCYGYFKLMRSIYKYFYSKINQVDPVVTSKQIKISSIFLVYSSFSNANYRVYYAALRFG